MSRQRVVYLGGTGRSGSTLLARLLGRRADYAPVGELRYAWARGFVDNDLCECGQPFRECGFWNAVVTDAFGGFDAVDVAGVRDDLRGMDRIRHVPELLSTRMQTAPFRLRTMRTGDVLERLYRSVASVSGRPIVVDSSKDASYAYVLHAVDRFDLGIVHLVRDSRAVAHSWTRTRVRPEISGGHVDMTRYAPSTSAWLWDAHNVLFEMLEHTDHPFARVRYEDLVRDTAAAISAITALHGLADAGPAVSDLGHSISGNPMRFDRGPLNVRVDDEWISAMTAHDRRVVTAATAPFLARYGYLSRRGADSG